MMLRAPVLMRQMIAASVLFSPIAGVAKTAPPTPPRIEPQGNAFRLIVQGNPMLMLGGELGNSSASSEAYTAPHWSRLLAMQLNTILSPVSWELTLRCAIRKHPTVLPALRLW